MQLVYGTAQIKHLPALRIWALRIPRAIIVQREGRE